MLIETAAASEIVRAIPAVIVVVAAMVLYLHLPRDQRFGMKEVLLVIRGRMKATAKANHSETQMSQSLSARPLLQLAKTLRYQCLCRLAFPIQGSSWFLNPTSAVTYHSLEVSSLEK